MQRRGECRRGCLLLQLRLGPEALDCSVTAEAAGGDSAEAVPVEGEFEVFLH